VYLQRGAIKQPKLFQCQSASGQKSGAGYGAPVYVFETPTQHCAAVVVGASDNRVVKRVSLLWGVVVENRDSIVVDHRHGYISLAMASVIWGSGLR
jgi:hypothetical protein